MGRAGAPMPSWMELWNEWEIQTLVVASFSLQVILFFFAGIRRYTVSPVLKALLWLVYLLADLVATYALGHMSSSLLKKSSSQHQLVAFWAPFLLLHLGGQDTITAYALEDNELWLRHLLNMFVQVAGTVYVLYKYIITGGATFVRAAMLVLATAFIKYAERIWALKLASKKGSDSEGPLRRPFLHKIYKYFCGRYPKVKPRDVNEVQRWIEASDCFTKNKQFGIHAFIVMTAHELRHLLVKPLIIERNEASISWSDITVDLLKRPVGEGYLQEDGKSGDASAEEKRHIGVYKAVEVELSLMYDMLYTKAQVIHTWYGYCARAISLVSCFAAFVVFMKSKRDGYSTPDIVITFALLGGACTLEMASVFKAIGSTWTYAILKAYRWSWLANAILFTRYHLVVIKDGRWSDSVGQFNFISFCAQSNKKDLKEKIAHLIGLRDIWDKACCTKHAKLSPTLKEFVWGFLKGDKRHMVQITEVNFQSGYWARRVGGLYQSEQLDRCMSYEFQKSVIIWHIATSIVLNDRAIKSNLDLVEEDMAEVVNTLSDYMMYLLIKHPDILPMKADDRSLFDQTCHQYLFELPILRHNNSILRHNNSGEYYEILLNCFKEEPSMFVPPGKAVLMEACSLARKMLGMKLGLTHRMVIIASVWTEMLCYAATNASGGFHARQLSNGGEFLTHVLLLNKYCSAIKDEARFQEFLDYETMEASAADHVILNVDDDETVEASAPDHVILNVDDDCNDVNTEIR